MSLTQLGWGVVLHFANGCSVRAQIYEYARKRYHAFMRAKEKGQNMSTPEHAEA